MDARGEVNELDGYFCVLTYKQMGDLKAMPRFVNIDVSATGRSSQGKADYSERVTEFSVQLTSEVSVESRYRDAVFLDRR